MKPLSEDLRERIVAGYEEGAESFNAVGRRFSVSGKVVAKLVRQKDNLGTLAAQVHLRGRKPAISGEKEVQLREHLQEYPDATVLERRAALGIKCCEKTLWQTLRKMGWRFKKSHHVPPSKIERM